MEPQGSSEAGRCILVAVAQDSQNSGTSEKFSTTGMGVRQTSPEPEHSLEREVGITGPLPEPGLQ